jgi:hypothetical protein
MNEVPFVCSQHTFYLGGEYRVLVGTPEGKRPLARPRHRWKSSGKLDLQERVLWSALIWLRIGTNGRLL